MKKIEKNGLVVKVSKDRQKGMYLVEVYDANTNERLERCWIRNKEGAYDYAERLSVLDRSWF